MSDNLTLFDVIKAIPTDVSCPEIFYEDDGCVSLDWIISKHRVLSMSVTPKLKLCYAWLVDGEHGSNTEQFGGEFSELLVDKLTKISSL